MINNRKLIAILVIVCFTSAMTLSVGAVSSTPIFAPDKDLELKFNKKNTKGVYVTVKNIAKKKTSAGKIEVYSYFNQKRKKEYTTNVKALNKGQSVKILIPAKVMNKFKAKKNGQGNTYVGDIYINCKDDANQGNSYLNINYGSKKGNYNVKRAGYE